MRKQGLQQSMNMPGIEAIDSNRIEVRGGEPGCRWGELRPTRLQE